MLVPVEDARVLVRVEVTPDRGEHGRGHLVAAGPDVLQEHGFPISVGPERIGAEVDVEVPRERVRDDERRRREICGLDLGMDATLEVPVAAEHRRHCQVLGIDAFRDVLGQRSAVADARRAAIADEVEAQLLE